MNRVLIAGTAGALLCGGAWASSRRAPVAPMVTPRIVMRAEHVAAPHGAVMLRLIGGGAAAPDAAQNGQVFRRRITGEVVAPHDPREVERFFDITGSPAGSVLDLFGAANKIRVNLDFDNTLVRDALTQIFDQAKVTYKLDTDIPADQRITVRARNVQLHTALNLITEAGGVGWTLEQKLAATLTIPPDASKAEKEKRVTEALSGTYHVGKTITTRSQITRVLLNGTESVFSPSLRLSDTLVPYTLYGKEERSTFTCPHCKQQSTMVRVKQQPKCPRCSRVFQPEWQFCPADGTRRPAIPGEWRFCPACGKPVMPEKAEDRNEPMGQAAPLAPTPPSAPGVPHGSGNLAPTANFRVEGG